MRIIRFLQPDSPYMTGEVAGFAEDVADRLIQRGIAEPHEPEPKPEPTPEPADATDTGRRRK